MIYFIKQITLTHTYYFNLVTSRAFQLVTFTSTLIYCHFRFLYLNFAAHMLVLQYMKLWSCYWLTLLHKDIPAVCIEWFILNFPFIQFCIACWWTLDSFTLRCYCCRLNSTNKEYVQGSLVVLTTCLYYSINNRVNLKVKWTWVPTVSLLINSTNIYILLGILVSNQPQSSNQYFQNQHTGIHQNAQFLYQK